MSDARPMQNTTRATRMKPYLKEDEAIVEGLEL